MPLEPTITPALQNLLENKASAEELALLREAANRGQISIGGNVHHAIIVVGSGNVVSLQPAALEALGGPKLLGGLEHDLNADELTLGFTRLSDFLVARAPCLLPNLDSLTRRLAPLIQSVAATLSDPARAERAEALAALNSLCLESLDLSFNALCLGQPAPGYDARCPFRGLEAFGVQDAEFFFGREKLTAQLIARLKAHPFLAVLGASGSGKSSLVMAGLVPALDLPYAVFRPGAEPLSELEKALQTEAQLWVVDQFEELFTRSKPGQRSEFIARLLEQAKERRVVLTLRADFLGEVAAFASLRDEVQNHQVIIPPMQPAELGEAMLGQAGRVGLRFEADLREQMLEAVGGEPGAMPLLQHALWELWKRRHGRWLKASEYRAFGGVKQAIARSAEEVYEACPPAAQERLRDIFIRLTRLDESGRDTRQRLLLEALLPAAEDSAPTLALLETLAAARLVVKSGPEVEVAHEALILHWERLRRWLDEDRESLRIRQALSEEAARWQAAGRDENLLNQRGPRLALALELAGSLRPTLNPQEATYLQACQSLAAREADAKRAQEQRESKLKEEKIQAELEKTRAELHAQRQIARRNYALAFLGLVVGLVVAFPTIHEAFLRWQARNAVPPVRLPAGVAQLGDAAGGQNSVAPDAYSLPTFEMEPFEVTNARYLLCIRAGKCSPPNATRNTYEPESVANLPVVNLSFLQAAQFCAWQGRRLPNDAEWERAARALDGRRWPWGEQNPASRAFAALDFSSGCINASDCFLQPVGQGASQPGPIYDLIGNAAEWTCTPFDADSPQACWAYGSEEAFPSRVSLRGFGAEIPAGVASAYGAYYREAASPTLTSGFIGFRCVEAAQP